MLLEWAIKDLSIIIHDIHLLHMEEHLSRLKNGEFNVSEGNLEEFIAVHQSGIDLYRSEVGGYYKAFSNRILAPGSDLESEFIKGIMPPFTPNE